MLGHKYDFLLQIFLKLMHTSHDFIAIKTCTSYEFLVVFEQLRVWDREVMRGLGWSAGRERAGFLKFLRVRDGFKFCVFEAGSDKKFQPAQDSSWYQHLLDGCGADACWTCCGVGAGCTWCRASAGWDILCAVNWVLSQSTWT